MNGLQTTGRILFAVVFLVFGINHFINGNQIAGYVPAWIPAHLFFVYLVGAGLVLAAVALIIQRYVKLAAILLGIMLLIFVFTIHLPMAFDQLQPALTNLLKDAGLAAASFFIAGTTASEASLTTETSSSGTTGD